jgi:hypothetical protein
MDNQSDKSEKRKELDEKFGSKKTILERTAKISSDGRQLLVRFPSKISEAIGMEKGDKINFKAVIDKENPEESDLEMEYEEQEEDE